jgi:hypothetical protein
MVDYWSISFLGMVNGGFFFCWLFAFTSNASLLVPFFFMTHFYPCRQKIVKKYGVIECDPLILTGLDGTVSQNKTSFSF